MIISTSKKTLNQLSSLPLPQEDDFQSLEPHILTYTDTSDPERGSATNGTEMGPSLPRRQREILKLLKAGMANKEIARELNISVGTVKQHLVSLFKRLGVSNRAMAIAKSFSHSEREATTVNTEFWRQHSPSDVISILEKRPAAVLSLKLETNNGPDKDAQIKAFYVTFTEVAFDFGAVFFSHNSGHCEMIFGVGRVRRHDVLRAIRAGVAVVEDIRSKYGETLEIRGGLAFGLLVASTDKTGAWSGEAIAGAVISKAHNLTLDAPQNMIRLDDQAREMIGFLGLDTGDGISPAIPLARSFHWRRAPLPTPERLYGRLVELEQLHSSLLRAKGGLGQIAIINSENGMGRSALMQSFAKRCLADDVDVETWVCSMPDTQPGAASLGFMEKPGTDLTRSVSEFADDLRHRKFLSTSVILIDDIHLLPKRHFGALVSLINDMQTFPVLFVVSGRGRMPLLDGLRLRATCLHLSHLSTNETTAMIGSLLGRDHKDCDRIASLAAGVPEFISELAKPRMNTAGQNQNEKRIPLTLFSVVTERIELIGLDRRFLHLIANQQEPVRVDDIRRHWPLTSENFAEELRKALRVGVLNSQAGDKRLDEFVCFRHPVVRSVMAAAVAGKDDLLQ